MHGLETFERCLFPCSPPTAPQEHIAFKPGKINRINIKIDSSGSSLLSDLKRDDADSI
jgi:hypothetical protein